MEKVSIHFVVLAVLSTVRDVNSVDTTIAVSSTSSGTISSPTVSYQCNPYNCNPYSCNPSNCNPYACGPGNSMTCYQTCYQTCYNTCYSTCYYIYDDGYVLTADSGHRVGLDVQSSSGGCDDRLEAYEGTSTSGTVLLSECCNGYTGRTVTENGNQMYFRFINNGDGDHVTFTVRYFGFDPEAQTTAEQKTTTEASRVWTETSHERTETTALASTDCASTESAGASNGITKKLYLVSLCVLSYSLLLYCF